MVISTRRIVRFALPAMLVLQASVAAAGGSWFLDSCSKKADEEAVLLKQAMMSAAPDSDVYLPEPFPQAESEVIDDLKYQLVESWSHHDAEQIPPDVKSMLSAVDRDLVDFSVLQVTDWRPERCPWAGGRVDSRFLVRMVDRESAKEMGRAVLSDSGLLDHFSTEANWELAHSTPRPWVAPLEDVRSLAAKDGLQPSDLQYVAVAGPTMACMDDSPCIALRSRKQTFLYVAPSLFALSLDRPGIAGLRTDELMREGPKRSAAVSGLREGESVVTVGGWHLAVATPVGPPPQP